MKRGLLLLAIAILTNVLLLAQNTNANGNAYENGNGPNDGVVIVPGTSIEHPGDIGRKAHTNHLIFQRAPGKQTYLAGLTPTNIQTAYQLGTLSGANIIAIVDAYHYPGAYNDLTTFSTNEATKSNVLDKCALDGNGQSIKGATPCFWQVSASSSGQYGGSVPTPPVNCGWNQEAALDIEWAHAMAPNAVIVLVEAQSNSFADLFGAVRAAATIVTSNAGLGEVSMSWGGSEFASEATYDTNFQAGGVVYIASSGDTGGKTIYPSVSPYVIAAGGTTLNMTTSGAFVSESGWSGSGGGPSAYEFIPSYQSAISSIVGSKRGVPDFSFDADPNTGVLVYGPTCSGTATAWMIFGGTSVSAPALAGIINSASVQSSSAGFASNTSAELIRIYGLKPKTEYRDITYGRAGKYSALPGWDFVTGIGTPLTLAGK